MKELYCIVDKIVTPCIAQSQVVIKLIKEVELNSTVDMQFVVIKKLDM